MTIKCANPATLPCVWDPTRCATHTERIASRSGMIEGISGSCDLCSAGHISRSDYLKEHGLVEHPDGPKLLTEKMSPFMRRLAEKRLHVADLTVYNGAVTPSGEDGAA